MTIIRLGLGAIVDGPALRSIVDGPSPVRLTAVVNSPALIAVAALVRLTAVVDSSALVTLAALVRLTAVVDSPALVPVAAFIRPSVFDACFIITVSIVGKFMLPTIAHWGQAVLSD